MKRIAILFCLVSIGVAVASCGGKDSGQEGGSTPKGELTETSIGPAEQGMTTQEVSDLFGEPDAKERFPGCELDPSSPAVMVWSWNVADGKVSLSFNADTERLDSYRTASRSFPTTNGVRVGDSFQVLKDSYGSTLVPLDLGAASTSRSGYWYYGDPARAELLFSIAGSKVVLISGGYLPPCE